MWMSRLVHVRRRAGFTLVEILIVVVIVGILASIILPSIANATTGSRQTVFATAVAQYNKAAQVFIAEQGRYFEDSATGQVPAGFEDYINADGWTGGTPIGGKWDATANTLGVTSAFGVHFEIPAEHKGDAYMTEIDAMIDDGNLASGMFQQLDADRYYVVLAR